MADWVPSRYGEAWTMQLTGALKLSVSREIGTKNGPPPPYRATVFGAVLKREFEKAEDAKRVVIEFAGQQLRGALVALPAHTIIPTRGFVMPTFDWCAELDEIESEHAVDDTQPRYEGHEKSYEPWPVGLPPPPTIFGVWDRTTLNWVEDHLYETLAAAVDAAEFVEKAT